MGTRRIRSWLCQGALGVSVLAGLAGPAAAAEPLDPALREAIETVVREYLLRNPEVVAEAIRVLQARQEEAERQQATAAIQARRSELLEDPAAPVGGNPAGDVTVVEFFDYRCGYCRAMAPTLRELVAADPGVRIVYKEFPILGPDSLLAARAALAARAQGRYLPFHEALMAAKDPLTLPSILAVARGVGLDPGRLERDMEAPEIGQAIERNHALAQALGVNATPAFVVGAVAVRGAVDLATLREVVARGRAR
jgi:protein-disulfide isomerase